MSNDRTRRRILIAEDSPAVARILRRQVERWTGSRAEVVVADIPYTVASMVAEIVATNPPDLVITDGLAGYAADVVNDCCEAGVPAIVYTGEPERYAALHAAVISKPADHLLRATIDDALSNAPDPSGSRPVQSPAPGQARGGGLSGGR